MLGLYDKEKIMIGKLFKYYRYQSKTKWQSIKMAGITSPTVYSEMENGKVFNNSTYYDEYLDFYHLSFKRKDNFDRWIKAYLPKACHAFIYYEKDQFEFLFEELQKECSDYKEIPIYHQYYTLFHYLFDYYKNNKQIELNDIKKLLVLFETNLFDIQIESLL